MCHNAVLQFVKSLARDADFHASKVDNSPGVCSFRADGIILLADEDCPKDMIIDSYGADPTRVSSLAAGSNLIYDNVIESIITQR